MKPNSLTKNKFLMVSVSVTGKLKIKS